MENREKEILNNITKYDRDLNKEIEKFKDDKDLVSVIYTRAMINAKLLLRKYFDFK